MSGELYWGRKEVYQKQSIEVSGKTEASFSGRKKE